MFTVHGLPSSPLHWELDVHAVGAFVGEFVGGGVVGVPDPAAKTALYESINPCAVP